MIALKSDSKTTKTRVRLTLVGWCWLGVIAGLATVGLYKNINLVVLLAYGQVALLAVNAWLVRRNSLGLTLARLHECRTFACEWGRLSLELTNIGHLIQPGVEVQLRVAGQSNHWRLGTVNAHQTIRLNSPFQPKVRGIIESAELMITDGFPFGFVVSTRQVGIPCKIVVYPRRGQLHIGRLLQLLAAVPLDRGKCRTSARQLAESADIHGLRPFRAGDSPRWIHWRTTARVGEPMVREFDRSSGPKLHLVLNSQAIAEAQLEQALSAAATVSSAWVQNRDSGLTAEIIQTNATGYYEIIGQRILSEFLYALAAWPNFSYRQNQSQPPQSPRDRKRLSAPVYIGSMGSAGADRAGFWLDPATGSEVYVPPVEHSRTDHDEFIRR